MHDGNSAARVVLCESVYILCFADDFTITYNMRSEMQFQCHLCYASETYQILSPVLFQQSLYFPLKIYWGECGRNSITIIPNLVPVAFIMCLGVGHKC